MIYAVYGGIECFKCDRIWIYRGIIIAAITHVL